MARRVTKIKCCHLAVGEISGEGSTEAPKPPEKKAEPEKEADDKRPYYGPPKPEYNAADDFTMDDDDSDSE